MSNCFGPLTCKGCNIYVWRIMYVRMKTHTHTRRTVIITHFLYVSDLNFWEIIPGNHTSCLSFLLVQYMFNVFNFLLGDIPYKVRRNIHDGAPISFSLIVPNHLSEVYPQQQICSGGPINQLVPSRYLNPLDYSVWGY